MNTKHISLAVLLALAPLTVHAQTTEATAPTATAPTETAPAEAAPQAAPQPEPTPAEPLQTDTWADGSGSSSSTTTTESSSSSTSSVAPPTVLIAIRAGGYIPQIFSNNLDASFVAGLGVGYVLPFLDYRVALYVDAFYTMPPRGQTLMDSRLASGSYTYSMSQNCISLFAGFLVHFTDIVRDMFIPYAGLGARFNFLWDDITGASGNGPLGTHHESSTQYGGAVRLGLGIRLGPGMIAIEAEVNLAPIDHITTGNMNIGSLVAQAGYTLVL
jgi:hypothetical protein